MPGDRKVNLSDPSVVKLFHHALYVQSWWVLLIAAAIASVAVWRRRANTVHEVPSHSYLRWSFGFLWLIDGALQLQSSMPLGLANQIVAPSANGSPTWLHSVVFTGVGVWNRHPIALAAATAWIQMGLGAAFLATRGTTLRVVAAVSMVWAFVIWLVGNAAGGVFSSDSSILFGWPGAVVFYFVAGMWLAGPPRWFPRTFSVVTLRLLSVVFALGAVVQALPDHGFWHGGPTNPLTAMTREMSQAAQPWLIRTVVRHSGELGALMGGGLNLVVIFWLAAVSFGLWRAARRDVVWPLRTLYIGAALIWLVAQDLAVFGGLSTDLNSMVPIVALAWCASPVRRTLTERTSVTRRTDFAPYRIALGALGGAMVIVATIPFLMAPISDAAETTLFLAQNKQSFQLFHSPAPTFTLTNQHNQRVTIPATTGRFTVLTFLDPKCWTDCPLLAHQLLDVQAKLSPSERKHVAFVAIAANPFHETPSDLRAFMAKQGLNRLEHFQFVTGSLAQMQTVWESFAIQVSMVATDKMSIHSDDVYIINPHGQEVAFIPDDPAPGWAGEQSAATELLSALHTVKAI